MIYSAEFEVPTLNDMCCPVQLDVSIERIPRDPSVGIFTSYNEIICEVHTAEVGNKTCDRNLFVEIAGKETVQNLERQWEDLLRESDELEAAS